MNASSNAQPETDKEDRIAAVELMIRALVLSHPDPAALRGQLQALARQLKGGYPADSEPGLKAQRIGTLAFGFVDSGED